MHVRQLKSKSLESKGLKMEFHKELLMILVTISPVLMEIRQLADRCLSNNQVLLSKPDWMGELVDAYQECKSSKKLSARNLLPSWRRREARPLWCLRIVLQP